MYTYLKQVKGARAGTSFLLSDEEENQIGRGLECRIVLNDPLSSRVHAIIQQREGAWWIRDQHSRNGTFVNRQKADEAQLISGCIIRLGSTEFEFTQSASHPDQSHEDTQTLVLDTPVSRDAPVIAAEALRDTRQIEDLLVLHQLAIRLLGVEDPDEVIRISLDLLHSCSQASVVGFLWVSDEGELKPKQVIPADESGKVNLSKSLTETVCQKRHAVWIDNQAMSLTKTLDHFADAICVPLVHDKTTLGALHMYLEDGRFSKRDFDLAIALANMLVVALGGGGTPKGV